MADNGLDTDVIRTFLVGVFNADFPLLLPLLYVRPIVVVVVLNALPSHFRGDHRPASRRFLHRVKPAALFRTPEVVLIRAVARLASRRLRRSVALLHVKRDVLEKERRGVLHLAALLHAVEVLVACNGRLAEALAQLFLRIFRAVAPHESIVVRRCRRRRHRDRRLRHELDEVAVHVVTHDEHVAVPLARVGDGLPQLLPRRRVGVALELTLALGVGAIVFVCRAGVNKVIVLVIPMMRRRGPAATVAVLGLVEPLDKDLRTRADVLRRVGVQHGDWHSVDRLAPPRRRTAPLAHLRLPIERHIFRRDDEHRAEAAAPPREACALRRRVPLATALFRRGGSLRALVKIFDTRRVLHNRAA